MQLVNSKIQQIEKDMEVTLYPKRGIVLDHGDGVYVYDTDGKKYLDCMTNVGVNILGYGNKTISEAIATQIQRLPSCHQSFYSEARAECLEGFQSIFPPSLSKFLFTNSGAESVEAALKIARLVTGKKQYIATHDSYHGRTYGALSATGQEKYRERFLPLIPGFVHVPFNNFAAIFRAITKDTAAIILEPIQGEAGFIFPRQEHLVNVKRLCKEKNILLIFDEVQSAIRTGFWLASDQYEATADIVCLSKSFSYGYPFGLVAVTKDVSDVVSKGAHGSTFAGNPVACIAAHETVKWIKKHDLLQNAREIGTYFLSELKKINNPVIKEVRGKGLMIGIEIAEQTTPYIRKMQNLGLLTVPSHGNTIRFLPPIILTKKQVDEAVGIVKRVFV
jgi:acetylornithine/succinyldiaminopimelate/putrescine aminotransferase